MRIRSKTYEYTKEEIRQALGLKEQIYNMFYDCQDKLMIEVLYDEE